MSTAVMMRAPSSSKFELHRPLPPSRPRACPCECRRLNFHCLTAATARLIEAVAQPLKHPDVAHRAVATDDNLHHDFAANSAAAAPPRCSPALPREPASAARRRCPDGAWSSAGAAALAFADAGALALADSRSRSRAQRRRFPRARDCRWLSATATSPRPDPCHSPAASTTGACTGGSGSGSHFRRFGSGFGGSTGGGGFALGQRTVDVRRIPSARPLAVSRSASARRHRRRPRPGVARKTSRSGSRLDCRLGAGRRAETEGGHENQRPEHGSVKAARNSQGRRNDRVDADCRDSNSSLSSCDIETNAPIGAFHQRAACAERFSPGQPRDAVADRKRTDGAGLDPGLHFGRGPPGRTGQFSRREDVRCFPVGVLHFRHCAPVARRVYAKGLPMVSCERTHSSLRRLAVAAKHSGVHLL